MNNNPFKGNELMKNKVDLTLQMQRMNEVSESFAKLTRESHEKEEKYKRDVLNALVNIEKNTGDIGSIVSLVQKNNENQKEVMEVLRKIIDISTSKTNEEADSKYREVMDKANNLNSDVDTVVNLMNYGKIVWLAVKEFIKNS